MILNQAIMELLVFFTNFLDLLLFVIFNLSYLTLKLIYFILLFLSMLGSFLSQVQEVTFAVSLGLLKRCNFGLQFLNHLCV